MPKQRDFYHISLKAILRNTQGKVLVLKAVKNGTLAGFYDLPGGRIDEDEFAVPLPEIIRREILEETGAKAMHLNEIPVTVGRHCIKKEHTHSEKDTRVFYVFFEAQIKEDDITISDEHEAFEWIDLKAVEVEKYFTSGILEGIKMYLLKNNGK